MCASQLEDLEVWRVATGARAEAGLRVPVPRVRDHMQLRTKAWLAPWDSHFLGDSQQPRGDGPGVEVHHLLLCALGQAISSPMFLIFFICPVEINMRAYFFRPHGF